MDTRKRSKCFDSLEFTANRLSQPHTLKKEIIGSELLHQLFYKTAVRCLRTSVELSDRLVLRGEEIDSKASKEPGPNPFRDYMNHFRRASWLTSVNV